MSRAVFAASLRQVRRAVLILTVSAAAFYYLVLLSSASFLEETAQIPFGSEPPKAIEALLGGSVDLLSPAGWFAAAMTHPINYALLVGAGLSVAAGAVATEVERGTIDLVLARPVGRRAFLLGKVAAGAVAVTLVEAGGLAGALIARATIERVGEVELASVLRAFGVSELLFVGLTMGAVLVSARSSLRGRAVGLAVGLVVAAFFLNFLGLLVDGVSWLRFLSPFHYYRPAEVLGDGVRTVDVAVLAGIASAFVVASLLAFARRDLSR